MFDKSLALLTDFYQLTMTYGYWKAKFEHKEAAYHLFFRRSPFNGGFTIAAGLQTAIEYIKNFHFDSSDLEYLSNLEDSEGKRYFCKDFLDYLANLKFTCDVDAVPEGTAVFPYEPLIRVTGPLIQCQIMESPLLNLINFPTLIATKAARICFAAQGDEVLEFGLRRAQGIDGALTASRAAFIGGCHATSNVLAGKLFGIPVRGTHAHSWIMVFEEELEAFKAYAESVPSNCVFLVDTYDSLEGVKKAIEVGKWLKSRGKKLLGIRLDSGDLAFLSIQSRKMLDNAGFSDTRIMASNELDETIISELKRQGAQVSVWGVGTNLVTAKDYPALDGVYKLSAIRDPGREWKYKLKLSEQLGKVSNPGILQVKRFYSSKGNIADVVYDIHTDISQGCVSVDPFDSTKETHLDSSFSSRDLLVPIFRRGELVYQCPTLELIRKKTQEELEQFPVGIKRFIYPHQYFVGMEKKLYDQKVNLIRNIRQKKIHASHEE